MLYKTGSPKEHLSFSLSQVQTTGLYILHKPSTDHWPVYSPMYSSLNKLTHCNLSHSCLTLHPLGQNFFIVMQFLGNFDRILPSGKSWMDLPLKFNISSCASRMKDRTNIQGRIKDFHWKEGDNPNSPPPPLVTKMRANDIVTCFRHHVINNSQLLSDKKPATWPSGSLCVTERKQGT